MSDYNSSHSNSSEAGQASPFAILLAALLGILVLALICTGAVFLLRGGGQEDISATSTAIAEANATTLAENARVTQTIAAMETEAARPTETPTDTPVPPTSTPTTTGTPSPTSTAVVTVTVEATPTPNLFGTSIFGGNTVTPLPGAPGPGPGPGALPTTGISLGSALAAALGLLLLLILARRLRAG